MCIQKRKPEKLLEGCKQPNTFNTYSLKIFKFLIVKFYIMHIFQYKIFEYNYAKK